MPRREKRHHVVETVGTFGGYVAVMRYPVAGVYAGATESRQDGCAMGTDERALDSFKGLNL
jgi:hypothetical protein